MKERDGSIDASNEIFSILRNLPSPRDAGRALAGAHVLLMEADKAENEAGVRARLKDHNEAVLDTWAARSGVKLAS
jgi:hypothetical protein